MVLVLAINPDLGGTLILYRPQFPEQENKTLEMDQVLFGVNVKIESGLFDCFR